MSIETKVKVKKVETVSKYYPEYHCLFKDYRGEYIIKLDESTARQFVSELDKTINFTEKVLDES